MLRRDKTAEDYQFISRLFVFQLTKQPRTYVVSFHAAHTVADGIYGATVARALFDVLCSVQRAGVHPAVGKLVYGVHNSRQDFN